DSERNAHVALRTMLAPLARACVRHKKLVIGVWLAVLVVISGVGNGIGPDYKTDFKLPDSETKQVFDLLQQNSPNQAGSNGQIVVKTDQGYANDPAAQAYLKRITDFAAQQPGVTVTTPEQNPQQISQNGQIAF